MGYSEKLKELAKKSYNRFINYIRNQRHLLTDERREWRYSCYSNIF